MILRQSSRQILYCQNLHGKRYREKVLKCWKSKSVKILYTKIKTDPRGYLLFWACWLHPTPVCSSLFAQQPRKKFTVHRHNSTLCHRIFRYSHRAFFVTTHSVLLFLMRIYHRVVLSFFSSRRNWDSPTPHPFGGRGTLAGERGVGRVPIPTRGHKLW